MPVPFSIAALHDELYNDPASLGCAVILAAPNPDIPLASLLNDLTKGTVMAKPISMLTFAKLAAASGIRQKLKTGQSSATYGAVCDTAIDMMGELAITFDPSDSLTQEMMGALVSAGIIASGDVDTVNSACTQPASRAENLWGAGTIILADQIAQAR